jgi:hypothetical protein
VACADKTFFLLEFVAEMFYSEAAKFSSFRAVPFPVGCKLAETAVFRPMLPEINGIFRCFPLIPSK